MEKPVKLLCVVPYLAGQGGIQRFTRTLLSISCDPLVQITVLSLKDDARTISELVLPANVTASGAAGNHVKFAIDMLRALRRDRLDVVLIGHINLVTLVMTVLPWTRSRNARTLMMAYGVDVWNRISMRGTQAVARLWRVLAISAYTRDSVLQQVVALDPDSCKIFPMALPALWMQQQTGSLLRPLKLPERYVLSVTRLADTERYKGIVSVLESIGNWRDTSLHYVLVGSGNDLPFLERTAQRCGVRNRVIFMKGLSDEQLQTVYRHARVFVLPSGKEGFGIVFLEAMHFELPVVAAHARGTLDVVRHEETGLLVEFGDVVGLAEAINRVSDNESLRQQLIVAGKALVVGDGEFTEAAMTKRWMSQLQASAS